MTSKRQTKANKQNAQQSTGPLTDEGKAAVRHNALRHGLLSKDVLLPDEDGDELSRLRSAIYEDLRPVGELETFLVDRIVAGMWRLRRALKVEADVYHQHLVDEKASRLWKEAMSFTETDTDLLVRAFEAADRKVIDQEGYDQAMTEYNALTKKVAGLLAKVFQKQNETDTFGKLIRYEAHIERGIYKALHELQRLQSFRTGQDVPLPAALDVTVSTGD